jgi:hypothetical protein
MWRSSDRFIFILYCNGHLGSPLLAKTVLNLASFNTSANSSTPPGKKATDTISVAFSFQIMGCHSRTEHFLFSTETLEKLYLETESSSKGRLQQAE